MKKSIKQQLLAFILIFGTLVIFLLFKIYPMISASIISFFKWDGFTQMKFIGFSNFKEALSDKIFWKSLLNTAIFTVTSTACKMGIGLLLAIMLNAKIKGLTFFRTVLFMPVVMSMTAAGLLWTWIYDPNFGLLSSLLTHLHLNFLIMDWMGNPRIALLSVVLIEVWKWTGFHMIIYLAGLQTINEELYEAAVLDGANTFGKLFKITVPMLTPYTTINLIMCTMGGLGIFDVIYVVTQGGPFQSTEVVMTYAYKQAFASGRVGYAISMILLLMIVITIVSFIQFRLRKVQEERV